MAESNRDPSAQLSNPQDGRRLDSWKEIAAYLNRDVTTVRRWERREGLPVHRHRHARLGSVYAFTTEIDGWQAGRERPPYREDPPAPQVLVPRLVGRDGELRRLHELLGQALEGARETVFVAGELGIGKTALIQTFLEQVRGDVWVAAGQCVEQYGRGEPYLPIIEGLERIVRDARYPEAIRIVGEHAPSWLGQFSFRSQMRPGRQRNVEPSAGQMAVELTAALEMLAAARPLVLLLEDLHWSDQATVEFVARLARRPERARLLVIGTYRPAELFESGSPLLRVGRELRVHFQAHEIELLPLTQDAVGDLIARDRTWADLRGTAALLRQWSGNPLFLIHFLEHLKSSGRIVERDGEWHLALDRQGRVIPNSLRMLVEEQVDRLEPDQRGVLEIASVVGETFSAAIIASAAAQDVPPVERLFEDLCRRSHLVTRRDATRLPDRTPSASYGFVHEFYRHVVYERLPRATLTELHRRIGEQLEAGYGTHAAEVSSELALHFDRGRDFGRAVRHYSIAAENALARNADREAQIALAKAAELLVQLAADDDVERMELQLRAQLRTVLERAARTVRWTSHDADQYILTFRGGAGDPELVDALIRLSRLHSVSGDLAAAKEIGDRAAAIAHRREHVLFEATTQQAYVRLLTGEFADSRSFGLEATAVADRDGIGASNRERARCSIVLAWATWFLGRYDDLRSTIQWILSKTAAERLADTAASMAPLLEWLGETDNYRLPRSSRGADRRLGLLSTPCPAEAIHGWLLVRRRRVAQGVSILQENADRLRTLALHSGLPQTLVWLAEGFLMNAHVEEALATAEDGLSVVRRTGARCCDAELYRARGEALIARKPAAAAVGASSRNRDAAEASFWAGITVARQQDARTLELRATVGLCRLLRDSGRQEEAIRTLAPICELFGRVEGTPDLADARRLLAGGTGPGR